MKTDTSIGTHALRLSVSLALGVGMTSAAGTAFAQDDEMLSTEGRVEVTGSRVKRADIEGALPVTVIDRNQIELSGEVSAADLIRNLSFNSFGSLRPNSGSSALANAGISLRGLGQGRTVVLIDGRRAPLASQLGVGQDLNAVPLAAIERIEILSDGASAIYGTDAIGGVVNIITRKNFTGAQASYGQARTTPVGGDTEEGSLLFGAASDRGQVMGGISFNTRDIIFQRHHFWTVPGASPFGNNFYYTDGATRYDDPVNGSVVPGGCNSPNFTITGTGSGQGCFYDFTGTAAYEAATDNSAVFVRGNYRINDVWSTYMNAHIARVESFGRYAPVPSFAFVPAASPNNPYGEDLYVAHRFAALGDRDNTVESNTYDLTWGFQGTVGMFDLDVGMRRSEQKAIGLGRNYLVIPIANQFIANGAYDLFNPPGNPDSVLNAMKTTTARESTSLLDEYYAIANTDLPFELSGGVVGAAFGIEYREELYDDKYDSLSEAGAVGGSAGSSSGLDRSITAMFFEVLLPVMPDLEVSIAGRHDDYSDYGSDFSPKLSARWQPLDALTLRASWGKGFAAPPLPVLAASPSSSADATTDPQTCAALNLTPQGGECVDSTGAAQTPQVTMWVLPNPALSSENSQQFSLGAAWDAAEWVNMSVDYYNIKLTDTLSGVSLAQMIACLDDPAVECPAGVQYLDPAPFGPAFTGDPNLGLGIARNATTGAIVGGQRGTVNLGELQTDGIDLNVRTNFAFGGYGTMQNQLQFSYVNSYESNGTDLVGLTDNSGSGNGRPQYRAMLNNIWAYGDFEFAWNISHITSYDDAATTNDPTIGVQTPSWTTHDLQVNYHTPWNGRMTVGVRNIADKYPPLDQGLLYSYDTTLYNAYGRTPYLRYTQTF